MERQRCSTLGCKNSVGGYLHVAAWGHLSLRFPGHPPQSTTTAIMALESEMRDVAALLEGLLADQTTKDWAAALQDACTSTWALLAVADPATASCQQVLDLFDQLLSDQSRLLIAQLVVPELRQAQADAESECSPAQREVLAGARTVIERTGRLAHSRLAGYESGYYTEEKEILRGAQQHQLCVLVNGDARLSDRQKRDFAEWFDRCPQSLLRGPSAGECRDWIYCQCADGPVAVAGSSGAPGASGSGTAATAAGTQEARRWVV